jgi:hypothetical protein
MISDDIEIVNYNKHEGNRFQHWINIIDRRSSKFQGKKRRREFLQFMESIFGPVGNKWTYQSLDYNSKILRFDQEQDLLIFLLKFKRR